MILIEAKSKTILEYSKIEMKLFVFLLSIDEIYARVRSQRCGQYQPGDGPPFPSWWEYHDDLYDGYFDGIWTEDMRVKNPSSKLHKTIRTDPSRGR